MAYNDNSSHDSIERIRQAFAVQRRALDTLEEAIIKGLQEHSQKNGSPLLLSADEVAQQLGMGRSWVYQQIKIGRLPSVRIGGTVKVRREDLHEYVREHRRRSPDNSF
jgi:excisionase family DNA binding protein